MFLKLYHIFLFPDDSEFINRYYEFWFTGYLKGVIKQNILYQLETQN